MSIFATATLVVLLNKQNLVNTDHIRLDFCEGG
jgi:hypothetical protein